MQLVISPWSQSTSVLLPYWRFCRDVPEWGLWVFCSGCGSSRRAIVGAWSEGPSQSTPCPNVVAYNVQDCSHGTPSGFSVGSSISSLLGNCRIPVGCVLQHTCVIKCEGYTPLSLFSPMSLGTGGEYCIGLGWFLPSAATLSYCPPRIVASLFGHCPGIWWCVQ